MQYKVPYINFSLLIISIVKFQEVGEWWRNGGKPKDLLWQILHGFIKIEVQLVGFFQF